MIYLASPYTHKDQLIMKTRFLLAEQVTARLLHRRSWVYSPIVHCHELALRYHLPTDFAYWRDYNFAMLRRCDTLYVLFIPGWEESLGVTEEIKFAQTAGIPVYAIDENAEFHFTKGIADGANNQHS